jgi:hypothetical protein
MEKSLEGLPIIPRNAMLWKGDRPGSSTGGTGFLKIAGPIPLENLQEIDDILFEEAVKIAKKRTFLRTPSICKRQRVPILTTK